MMLPAKKPVKGSRCSQMNVVSCSRVRRYDSGIAPRMAARELFFSVAQAVADDQTDDDGTNKSKNKNE